MTEVTVVGGGFVGLAFSLAAARQGLRVSVYDQKPRPVMPESLSANVIAVNPATRQFLEELGVWSGIPEFFATPYAAMEVADATGAGQINFQASDAGLPVLGHIVNQNALLAALASAIAGESLISMHWETPADLEEIEGLVIGADGAHSKTREQLGIRKVSWQYDQTATVCIAKFEQPHGQVARQWFQETGPVALLPLSEPDQVAVVWSSSEKLAELDEGTFLHRLAEAVEDTQGAATLIGERFSFPLMQMHALQYVRNNVALLGDAAHAIHPLAGQGANLGFADARDLALELGSAALEGRDPGDLVILKRFERRRMPENQAVAAAMEGFHRLFTSKSPLAGLIRNQGLRWVDGNESLKLLAISVATGRL